MSYSPGGFEQESRVNRVSKLFGTLLRELDPHPTREDLTDTPMRAARAWVEDWCSGYTIDPAALLKTFVESGRGYDQLVVVSCIPFFSSCAHHLAQISGVCHIGYLPRDRIVGLSKLPRIVDAYARRLQTQEMLTTQIAECVMEGLNARAVGVIMRATHGCLSSRGARVHGGLMSTAAMLGELKDDAPMRAEFLSLCDMAERSVK